MKILHCLNCGSEKILPNIRIRIEGVSNWLNIQIDQEPDALIFKESHLAEIQGMLCLECGFLHTFVIGDMNAIRTAYEKYMENSPIEALESLGSLGVPRLLKILAHSSDLSVRRRVVRVLDHMDWKPQNERERMLYLIAKENIEIVFFGTSVQQQGMLCNPELTDVIVPMPFLKQIVIDTATYEFHHIERFLTYAVNALGQKYLKKHVNVQVYGDPEELHANLRNSLTNLCKHVYNRS